MSGLCLVLSGFALLLMFLFERITTAPVIEDQQCASPCT